MKSLLTFLSCCLFLLYPSVAEAGTTTKKVMSFNVLADAYADPAYYPEGAPLNGTERRLTVIREMLAPAVAQGVDIIGLQEVSIDTPWEQNPSIIIEGQYKHYKAFMESQGFTAFHAPMDKTYWGKYYDYTNPNVFNAYVATGNALFLRTSKFSSMNIQNVRLSTGNHLILAKVWDIESQKYLRMACIHYDSDVAGNTRTEFIEALALMTVEEGTVNIMFGDHNTGFYYSPMAQTYLRSAFMSTVYYLQMVTGRDDIVYRSRPENVGWWNNRDGNNPMDHVLFESAKIEVSTALTSTPNEEWRGYANVTINGFIDKRVWVKWPEIQGNDLNHAPRVNAWMGPSEAHGGGSDHFAVIATLTY